MGKHARDEVGAGEGALPTFIVIGAMKSGTTSIASYLAAHPDVFMTTPKEPHFFNREKNWERGVEWYRSLFAPAGTARARGEATPGYTKAQRWPETAERIAAVVPDARLIYLVRNPIERIKSHYTSNVLHGERRPINEAITEDAQYVDASLYAFQVERYLEHFDLGQIMVLCSDDLREHRVQAMTRTFEFIGVDPEVDIARRVLRRELNRAPASLRSPTGWSPYMVRIARRTPLSRLPRKTRHRMRRLAGRRRTVLDTTLRPDVEARLCAQLATDGHRLEALIGQTPPWLARLE